MPCTIQPWEAEADEVSFNKRTYGAALTDYQLVVRLLCEAVTLIPPKAKQSKALKLWMVNHAKRDREVAAMNQKVIAARKKKGT